MINIFAVRVVASVLVPMGWHTLVAAHAAVSLAPGKPTSIPCDPWGVRVQMRR